MVLTLLWKRTRICWRHIFVCYRRRRLKHRSSFLMMMSGSRQSYRLFNTVTVPSERGLVSTLEERGGNVAPSRREEGREATHFEEERQGRRTHQHHSKERGVAKQQHRKEQEQAAPPKEGCEIPSLGGVAFFPFQVVVLLSSLLL